MKEIRGVFFILKLIYASPKQFSNLMESTEQIAERKNKNEERKKEL